MTAMELNCPRCLSKDVRRSRHSSFLPLVLAQFGLHPYRCRNCRKRFFRSGECVTLWDVEGPAPVFAALPVNVQKPQPWFMETAPRTDARSSRAVRRRDWAQLLARSRVA
jgi:hypothetical protein